MTDEQFERLIQEIRASRQLNTEEHDAIKASAAVAQHLSEDIQKVLNVFNGFMSTITFFRNLILPVALIWLVFEKPLLALMGAQ